MDKEILIRWLKARLVDHLKDVRMIQESIRYLEDVPSTLSAPPKIPVMKAVSEFAVENGLSLSVRDSDWVIFKERL